ncbi:hypothetical protein [Ornithinimicrobium sp. Y1694]|uniref:hypothetical protein n=1 Tax=Ornithinimicrobium sp. Y1694 TaxID=3418590 RepID=UPI003CF9CC59
MGRPATLADLRRICEDLPETELGSTWGDVPSYVVPRGPKGRAFCMYRQPRKDAIDPATGEGYQDLIVIRTAERGFSSARPAIASLLVKPVHTTGAG